MSSPPAETSASPGLRRTVVRRGTAIGAAVGVLLAPVLATAPAGASGGHYAVTNLVSDVPGAAMVTDPHLVNAWGMSQGPSTPVWVSDNGMDVTTLYTNASPSGVTVVPLVVSIPGGEPTGQVFNPTAGDFIVRNGDASGPARFIFDSEAGVVSGWNPGVPPPPTSTQAQVGATEKNAVYKGLAMGVFRHRRMLYAANFHAGRIDVYDARFHRVHLGEGAFRDRDLPAGYAPFNVMVSGERVYVSYAQQDADAHDDVAGPGHGFIDTYSLGGRFVQRLVTRGELNSPWGMVVAPSGFGEFSGDLLVGNFGNGRIHAYDPMTGALRGTVRDANGDPITIDGLWGLLFGNGTSAATTTLLFSAGPDGEAHGLFGVITTGS